MRRFYQESWQGIPFTTFAYTHFFHLADAKFYAVFYEELFRRFQNWNDLPEAWRASKRKDARWLAKRLERIRTGKKEGEPVRVLSIGCGVGYMERVLLEEIPEGMDLYLNEPSTVGMKWMRRLIPGHRIFIGEPPDCLSPDIHYDMIYLSAVDYCIPQQQLDRMLAQLRHMLLPGGEIVCLSASLLVEQSKVAGFVNFMKNCIRCLLHYSGIRRQQFWGWRRTREEYRETFRRSDLKNIEDGHLEDGFNTYWIRGE